MHVHLYWNEYISDNNDEYDSIELKLYFFPVSFIPKKFVTLILIIFPAFVVIYCDMMWLPFPQDVITGRGRIYRISYILNYIYWEMPMSMTDVSKSKSLRLLLHCTQIKLVPIFVNFTFTYCTHFLAYTVQNRIELQIIISQWHFDSKSCHLWNVMVLLC